MGTRLPTLIEVSLDQSAEATLRRLRTAIDTRTAVGPENTFGFAPVLEGYAHDGRFKLLVQRRLGEQRQGRDSFRIVAHGQVLDERNGSRLTARVDLLNGRYVRVFRVVFALLVMLFVAFAGLLAVTGARGTAPTWVFIAAPALLGLLAELGFRYGYARAGRDADMFVAWLEDRPAPTRAETVPPPSR